MLHVSYGVFDDPNAAKSAMVAIEARNTPPARLTVILHRDRLDPGLLGEPETGAAEGHGFGAALGGIAGAITGAAIMGSAGLLSGGALGMLYGSVAGALGGAGAPDRTLERFSKLLGPGKALVVVEAPSLEAQDAADAEMRARGGKVEHKPLSM